MANLTITVDEATLTLAQARAREVMRARPDAVISTQVPLAWYSVVTCKFDPPMPAERAADGLATLAEFDVIGADAELVIPAAEISTTHQLSIWDAMIIESARLAGCGTVLTEALEHGRTISWRHHPQPVR